MELKIILEHGDDGMIVAYCLSLKSCWSQGRTRDEALQNIREAINLYLKADPNEQTPAWKRPPQTLPHLGNLSLADEILADRDEKR